MAFLLVIASFSISEAKVNKCSPAPAAAFPKSDYYKGVDELCLIGKAIYGYVCASIAPFAGSYLTFS